ncbi:lamin tail domain-containing protein [Patescibacteria group bacterium]|nr:lamin tail domain-containing protein [Patescibacteria group bacterium]
MNGDIYRLLRVNAEFSWRDLLNDVTDDNFLITDRDHLIESDYWSRLSKQAVLHGAGVVKLFFDEVEKERQSKVLFAKNKSWFTQVFDATKGTIFNIASIFYGSSVTLSDFEDQKASVEEVLPSPTEQVSFPPEPEVLTGQGGAVTAFNLEVELPSEPQNVQPVIITDTSTVKDPSDSIRDSFGLVRIPASAVGAGGGAGPEPPVEIVPPEPPDTIPPDPPIITSPKDFSKPFTQSTTTFSGTAEKGATISQSLTTATTTTASTSTWSLDLTLDQGTTTVQFFATDQAGNKSQPAEIIVFIDSVGPNLSFFIAECAHSFSTTTTLQSGCLTTSTTATLTWSSDTVDLKEYELSCEVGGIGCSGFPKLFSATTTVTVIETLSDNSLYIFNLKAIDNLGNETIVSKSIETTLRPVVINEIAWMGTATSSSDEWIELYNTTSQDISLEGWVFRAEDGAPYITLKNSILAGGYYLIERSDDNTISDIDADLVVPFSGSGNSFGLGNRGEHLFLERVTDSGTTTVDEVTLCGPRAKWCAGSNRTNFNRRTMERYDFLKSGTDPANWGTALGEFILNGKDAAGNPIKGTPKAKNSISYQIANGHILNIDKTLTKANSPYLIPRLHNLDFIVEENAILTLEPGVVVKIVSENNPSLIVKGTINAQGTAADPVVFTAFADDEYGGDMNGDGVCDPDNASSTAICPGPGSWQQIAIGPSSQNSSFTHTIIRYGGRWFSNVMRPMRSMVLVDGTDAEFKNVTIEYSQKHGLSLRDSSSTITDSLFRYDTVRFPYDLGFPPNDSDAAGMFVSGGSPVINNNTFHNHRYGLRVENSPSLSATSNTFTKNTVEAVHVSGVPGTFRANSASDNAINGIVIGFIGNITSTGTTTLTANPMPYVIKHSAKVVASSTLTFEPQTVIKGYPNIASAIGVLRIKNGAKIFFDGSLPTDLIFTSFYDDSIGGDTDNATTTMPQAGDWIGIVVEKGGSLEMKGFSVQYAETGLTVVDGSAILQDAIFANNELDIKSIGDSLVNCISNCTASTTDPENVIQ